MKFISSDLPSFLPFLRLRSPSLARDLRQDKTPYLYNSAHLLKVKLSRSLSTSDQQPLLVQRNLDDLISKNQMNQSVWKATSLFR